MSPIPGPALRTWGLALITNPGHDLKCQIEGFGINVEGKGATKGCGVGETGWDWQGKGQEAVGAPLLLAMLLTPLPASVFSEVPVPTRFMGLATR